MPNDLPPDLKRLWRWVKLFTSNFKSSNADSPRSLIGIRSIIGGINLSEHQRSDHHYAPWIGFEHVNAGTPLKVALYKSEAR